MFIVESQAQSASRSEQGIDEVAEAVRGVIAHHLKVRPEEIALESRLEGELEIDSMAMIEINVSLEERFRVAMPDMAVASSVSTVRDLARFIHAKVAEGKR